MNDTPGGDTGLLPVHDPVICGLITVLPETCQSCAYFGTGYGGCKLAWERKLRANCPYWKSKGEEDDDNRPVD